MLSNPSNTLSLAAISISTISVIWTISHNYRQSKADRIRETRALFDNFMAFEMISLRGDAWFFLENINSSEEEVTFSSLWSDPSLEEREAFDKLYHVLEFWFLFRSMDRQKTIDRKLAKELFSYHYTHWRTQLSKLIKNSIAKDWDSLDMLHSFGESDLDWLDRKASERPNFSKHFSS